jgi:hypothetical protein
VREEGGSLVGWQAALSVTEGLGDSPDRAAEVLSENDSGRVVVVPCSPSPSHRSLCWSAWGYSLGVLGMASGSRSEVRRFLSPSSYARCGRPSRHPTIQLHYPTAPLGPRQHSHLSSELQLQPLSKTNPSGPPTRPVSLHSSNDPFPRRNGAINPLTTDATSSRDRHCMSMQAAARRRQCVSYFPFSPLSSLSPHRHILLAGPPSSAFDDATYLSPPSLSLPSFFSHPDARLSLLLFLSP